MCYIQISIDIQFKGEKDLSEKLKVTCMSCGTTNYFPLETNDKKVVCGRCKVVLPKPGTVVEPSPEQVQPMLQNSSLPVLVDFYSPTCVPCHMMSPVVENLASRRAGELTVLKINVDSQPQLAAGFDVQGVPTFVIVHKGNERDRMTGAVSETDFSLWVASRI